MEHGTLDVVETLRILHSEVDDVTVTMILIMVIVEKVEIEVTQDILEINLFHSASYLKTVEAESIWHIVKVNVRGEIRSNSKGEVRVGITVLIFT